MTGFGAFPHGQVGWRGDSHSQTGRPPDHRPPEPVARWVRRLRARAVTALTTQPATAPPAKRGRRASRAFRPDIQALRALAVTSVLLYHLWPNRLTGGFVGVDVFFVISGYLITSHLVRERERTGRIALGRFWARRATRLLPASLLVLLVTAVAVIVWVPRSLWQQFLGEITASALYVQNWRLFSDSVDYLAADNQASPVQHFWTLSAEEQFYVLLPLLLVGAMLLFRRFAWRRVVVAAIAVATVASFAYSVHLVSTAPSQAYFSTFSRAWEFGVGALLSLLPAIRRRLTSRLVAAGGVIAILVSVVGYSGTTPFPGVTAALPVLGTAAAIWGGRASVLEPLGRVAPVAFLGRVSYSVYLWHWSAVVVVPFVTGVPLTTVHKVGIAVGTCVLAWLSTTYVEDRVRHSPRLLGGRRPRAVAAWSAAGMAGVLAISLTTVQVLRIQEQRVEDATMRLVAEQPDCFGAQSMDPKLAPCENPELDAQPLVPSLADIESDDANRAACWARPEDAELRMCSLGPESGYDKRIVAIGDSHNNALLPAYEAIADALNWRIDVAGHAGCFWTDEPLRLATTKQTAACTSWRAAVGDLVETADDVDAYLVTRSSGDTDASDDRAAAMASAWAKRADTSVPVIALLDNPRYPEAPVTCVATAPATANDRCALPPDEVTVDDGLRRAADADPNTTVVDLSRFYCTDDLCPVVVGGVIVYRDANHLTATYASTVAPYLAAELDAAVG